MPSDRLEQLLTAGHFGHRRDAPGGSGPESRHIPSAELHACGPTDISSAGMGTGLSAVSPLACRWLHSTRLEDLLINGLLTSTEIGQAASGSNAME
jgi:hypothetical protein